MKKLARERAQAITLRIPQLKDGMNHFDQKQEKGKDTMVIICESQSAAGSLTSCRDVNNQAVFVPKGKALNVEDNTGSLRYEKVILATDAELPNRNNRQTEVRVAVMAAPNESLG